jgi:two-component system CheB/CheR fusion protein
MIIDLCVKPLLDQIGMRNLMMVMFKATEAPSVDEKGGKESPTTTSSGKTATELEQELHYTRQTLQSTIEELKTSNEELMSTNEELQSTNEELQSTNEELETSKEELQSLNEESITVNTELQNRIDELSQSNDDMKNLLDSTDIATIFLDTELCIRRFTSKATEIMPLTASDNGRPLHHLVSNLVETDLSTYAREVLKDLSPLELEVKNKKGHYYLLRVRPYRTLDNVIDGVVMTFDDISRRKAMEAALKQSEEQLTLAFQATNDAVWDWDLTTGQVEWNTGYENLYGGKGATTEDTWQWRMEHIHPEDSDKVIASLQAAINGKDNRWQAKFRYRRANNSYVSVIDRAFIIRDDKGKAIRILGAMLDISQFKD